jgi:PAS domain S-box-containing protein
LAEAQQIAGLGSWDWDLQGDRVALSDEMCDLLGLPAGSQPSSEEFLGRVHPEDRASMQDDFARILAGEPSLTVTFRVPAAGGDMRILRGAGRLVEDWGARAARIVGVAQDVTEMSRREAIERERQKLVALGELAGGVAHELNNLLQPILSLTELARDRMEGEAVGTEERRDMCDDFTSVLEYARQAREIVRKILLFARKDTPGLAEVDFAEAVGRSVAFLRDLLPPAVVLETHIAPSLVGRASINRVELTQLITNIAVNAAQAMEGKGVLTVALASAELSASEAAVSGVAAGRHFVLSITDTGCGMSEAVKARIFEPFFTTKPIGQGTGLGLSVAHGILRSWNGAISVESSAGQGTSFTLIIPQVG